MRGIHSAFTRGFVLNSIAPLTDGGTLNLVDGQVGLFIDKPTKDGAKAVATVTDYKNTKYFLEVGTGVEQNGAGMTSKGMRTVPFLPADVLDITFSPAQDAVQAIVFIGNNGSNNDSLDLVAGEASQVHVTLRGAALAYYGYKNGEYTTSFSLYEPNKTVPCGSEVDECAPISCKKRTLELIEEMKNHKMRDGLTLSHFVKITPVISCFEDLTPTGTANFYTLELVDAGDAAALAAVRAQVAGFRVERVSRVGQVSKYQVIITDGSGAPDDFEIWADSIKTNCGVACPDGYTSSVGGYLYSVALDDAGANVSSTFLNSVASLTATVGKIKTVSVGAADALRTAGTYTGIAPNAAASSLAGVSATFTVVVDGSGAATVTVTGGGSAFVVGETITIADSSLGSGGAAALVLTVTGLVSVVNLFTKTGQEYNIGKYALISENELTETEIAELLSDYPSLKIDLDFVEVDEVCIKDELDTVEWIANGTCNISEEEYTIVLADNDCGTSRLAELQSHYPNLTITEGTDYTCRKQYVTTVPTNIVCDECFPDVFTSVAPSPFEFSEWVKTPAVAGDKTDCKCGIRLEAIELTHCPDKKLADRVGTILGQTEIFVSAGEMDSHIIGYKFSSEPNEQTRDKRAYNGSGFGVDFMQLEKESYDYALGIVTGGDYVERQFKGVETKLDPCGKYDVITLKVKRTIPSQSMSGTLTEFFRYQFVIPQGSLELFKDFFNTVIGGNPEAANI